MSEKWPEYVGQFTLSTILLGSEGNAKTYLT